MGEKHTVMTDFLSVSRLVSEKKKDEAEKMLRQIEGDPFNESRVRLWAWNGLRELGVRPQKPEVLGVVIEMPIQHQTEYLAIYKDGRVRYINYTGSAGIWEAHSKKMDEVTANAISVAQEIITEEKYADGKYPEGRKRTDYTDSMRIDLLTTAGVFQTEKADREMKGRFMQLLTVGVQVIGGLGEEGDVNHDTGTYFDK
jgi:hypothetical protein